MRIGDVLSRAWDLYTRFFAKFVLTAVPVFVVLGLVNAVLGQAAQDGGLAVVVWGLVSIAVSLIGYFWLQGALVEAVVDVRDGRADFSVGELYSRARPRLPALIAAGVIAGVAIGIGFVLLLIPGLFLLTRWILIGPTIVVEGRSAGESFSRSWELVKGSSWRVLGLILITLIGAAIVGGLLSALFLWLPDFFDTWVGDIVANSLTAPFVVLSWTLAYFQLAGEPAAVEPGEPEPTATY